MGRKKIIITVASYPERMDAAYKVLRNMLVSQTVKPDLVILNLFEGHFPKRKLPSKISKLTEQKNFEVHWYKKNMRSYNKFLYAFEKYSNELVITVDDDINYPKTLVERLIEGHEKWPRAIIASRTHIMLFKSDGSPLPVKKWAWCEHEVSKNCPSRWLYFTTGGGTLFVPRRIVSDKFNVFDTEMIKKEAPYDDDAWLNVAAKINNVDVVQPYYYPVHEKVFVDTQSIGLWETVNSKAWSVELPNRLFKKYGIKNRDLGIGEKWLVANKRSQDAQIAELRFENSRLTAELDAKNAEIASFLSIKRSARLLGGNIKRRITKK